MTCSYLSQSPQGGTEKTCYACHQKKDRHNGKLGKQCARCHDPKARSWRLSDFDHETKTRFSLTLKHAGIKCIECHKVKGEYGDLSGNCATCHMKN